jgi:hypothetical protein
MLVTEQEMEEAAVQTMLHKNRVHELMLRMMANLRNKSN